MSENRMRQDQTGPATTGSGVMIPAAALDAVCPLHLLLDRRGRVLNAGPTFDKLLGAPAAGRDVMQLLQVLRPQGIGDMAGLAASDGGKLRLRLAAPCATVFAGTCQKAGPGQYLLALSFGIQLAQAVQRHALCASDFAATDLAIELLYLSEAKSAAMVAAQQLSHRLAGAHAAAEQEAQTDPLTGLCNRRALEQRLTDLIATGQGFALMTLDLDFFKAVNDEMGHDAGDHVLCEVAQILREETRDSDTVARLGGDEFVLIIGDIQDQALLQRIGQRIITRLSEPIPFGQHRCQIAASIGTALSRDHRQPTPAQLLKDADIALYASKAAGRARQTFFSPALTR